MLKRKLNKKEKEFAVHTILLVVLFLFVNQYYGNPIKDFILRFSAEETLGLVTYAGEYEVDADSRGMAIEHGHIYEYEVNGNFHVKKQKGNGYVGGEVFEVYPENPQQFVIEYVSFLPSVSRVKGTGFESFLGYLLKSLLLKTFIYFVIIWFYIKLTDFSIFTNNM